MFTVSYKGNENTTVTTAQSLQWLLKSKKEKKKNPNNLEIPNTKEDADRLEFVHYGDNIKWDFPGGQK